ncbi:hypothetical protein [Chryseobacterium geocarposphaerae]|uniref:YD repeat-containing protein n=1 Tax=Chryseobacterium geocarposphaerae TaxID=1416776 RepID=A0A2M9C6F4_9FLAO|nr:hypothetical protein [Chryseobacterium geocarposphaerae]PJJ66393.1 YD repeat-containing protein [Chryseobacterium geocarposphaerae]
MRKTILLFTFLSMVLYGQQGNQNLQLPTIIPPSPTVQNFMRYGEIPVDYSTGVPKIEIPIYTIQGRKLSLPISISYHASGIKVYDIPSEVGLGWVLNAGGIITRTMLDAIDEKGATNKIYANAAQFLAAVPTIVMSGYNTFCWTYPGPHSMEMYLNANPSEDRMSDRYFYKLPNGGSGVFRYNYPQTSTLITLPYRPYNITKTVEQNQSNGNVVTEFQIIDDQGIIHKFKRFQDSSYGSSEWFLTEMSSPDGQEKIKFSYNSVQTTPNGMPNDTFISKKDFVIGVGGCQVQPSQGDPSTSMGGTGGATNAVILSSIESEDIIINFLYANREDFPNLKKLTEVQILPKNNPNTIKKKFIFQQSYFGTIGYENTNNRDKRLKLDMLNIYGEDAQNSQKYTFDYEQSIMLPAYSSRSYDFWGYFNGSNYNGTAIPYNFLPVEYQNPVNGTGYGGDRKADNGYFSKACMLKEIKYPAGGRTEFKFERAYADGVYRGTNGGGYIGGFRVASITNYSKDNNVANIKSYQYSQPKFNIIDPEFYTYPQWTLDLEDPNGDFVPCQGTGGCWRYYKQTIVTSNPIVSHDLTPGMPIAYLDVTEYDGTPTNNMGSTEYHYSSPDHISYTDLIRELHTYQEDWGNYEPKLGYKLVKNQIGNKISEEIFQYSNHFQQEFLTGFNITRTLTNLANNKNIDLTEFGCHNCLTLYIQSIRAHDTKAYQNANLLDYTIKRTYDQNNQSKYVEERIDYAYNQHNLMVKQAVRKNSLGDDIFTQYKYPYDFGTAEPYQTMLTKNILTPIIEQTVINTTNGKQIQKLRTLYDKWVNNSIIEPKLVQAQADSSLPLEDRVRFMSYDQKGNATNLKKENGIPITYIWGYDKTLPIAMVENSNLVSQAGTNNQDKTINSNLFIPMGSTVYELGSFVITEEKNYMIERIYEKIPNDKSVMYQVSFENIDNSAGSVLFTDSTPAGGNSHTFTTASQLLKPGNYKVKLVNIGYNGYQGSIEHQFNFTIYNTVNIEKAIPFHTSFEEDVEYINTTDAKTGNKSHVGQYSVKLPDASLGYDKVVISYWGKTSAGSPWQYVEDIVDVAGQNVQIGQAYNYIDEVRVYPVNSMMTTYTYDPFYKQPTSIMKPNGQTEYYNYDSFGRLKEVYIIEDNVKKVIKSNTYHYKQ